MVGDRPCGTFSVPVWHIIRRDVREYATARPYSLVRPSMLKGSGPLMDMLGAGTADLTSGNCHGLARAIESRHPGLDFSKLDSYLLERKLNFRFPL